MSEFRLRSPQLILSLCDRTGAWSRPYDEVGYDVQRIEIEDGQDVRLLELPNRPVHGILAAPPCTVFANSGARWPRTDEEMLEGLSVVDACCRIILAAKPKWWVLENPHGKLSRYLGPPAWTFQPNDYGDDYTKFTCLWGDFAPPVKTPATCGHRAASTPRAPSAPTDRCSTATPKTFSTTTRVSSAASRSSAPSHAGRTPTANVSAARCS
jgi:hypothetical protein